MTEGNEFPFALHDAVRSIVDSIGDGVSIQDRSYRILFQNSVQKSFIGEHAGEYCYRAYENRDRVCDGCPVARTFEDGGVHTSVRAVEIAGETRYFEITSSPVRDDAGAVVAATESVRDVTARERGESALRDGEQRYRTLLSSVTDYIYTVRVADGRAAETVHGPGCAAVTGYTAEEYAASPFLWLDMVFPDDRAAVEEHAGRLVRGEKVKGIEHRIIHKDGTLRWVRNTPVQHFDEQGLLASYDALISDITERKRIEQELMESQQLLESVIETAPT